jgi:hypothetical protein
MGLHLMLLDSNGPRSATGSGHAAAPEKTFISPAALHHWRRPPSPPPPAPAKPPATGSSSAGRSSSHAIPLTSPSPVLLRYNDHHPLTPKSLTPAPPKHYVLGLSLPPPLRPGTGSRLHVAAVLPALAPLGHLLPLPVASPLDQHLWAWPTPTWGCAARGRLRPGRIIGFAIATISLCHLHPLFLPLPPLSVAAAYYRPSLPCNLPHCHVSGVGEPTLHPKNLSLLLLLHRQRRGPTRRLPLRQGPGLAAPATVWLVASSPSLVRLSTISVWRWKKRRIRCVVHELTMR